MRREGRELIYLDHGATSWPKPARVMEAMTRFMTEAGANPGHSGHSLSVEASRRVFAVRKLAAKLFNSGNPLNVVFSHNATAALNMALRGYLRPGDRVVTTSVEHNSVMRPLRALEKDGVEVVMVECDSEGKLPLERMRKAVGSSMRMVVMTHASNVTGAVLPAGEVAEIAHGAGAVLLVDSAQTAGAVPIDMKGMGIDLLAFTGHKGLLGPTGTGGLALSEDVDVGELRPVILGGTGSGSELEEQPECLPDRFESGTLNGVGIAGLGAGIEFVMTRGVEKIRDDEARMAARLVEGLRSIDGVTVYGPQGESGRTGVVSFVMKDRSVSDVGRILDEDYGVLCRVGMHCSPSALKTIGAFPSGTARFSVGYSNTPDEIEAAIDAVREVAVR